MQVVQTQGHAFPEDFFLPNDGLMWMDSKWRERLDKTTAERRFGDVRYRLSRALHALAERQQARATVNHLLRPLAELLGWRLGERTERVDTPEGEEELGHPIFTDSEGSEPILYARSLAPDASFDAPPEGHHRRFTPTLVMERTLLEKGHNFGILLNGTSLRLLHFESGMRSWLQVDLTAIADGSSEGHKAWLLLWALLSCDALKRHNLWDAIAEARQQALKVGEDLGKQIQEAIKILLNAIISHPENQACREELLNKLPQLYEEALRFLYRLLFVLYAEARSLLPLDLPVYKDGYSLSRWTKWAFEELRRNKLTERDCFLEATIKALFKLLWIGADLGLHGKIPAYKGNLFEPNATPTINKVRIGDKTLAEVLTRLAYRQTQQGWRRVSYRNLAVEHIGSVYETLLEFRPEAAREPMWEVQVNGRSEFLNKAQLLEVLRRRPCINPESISDPELAQLARLPSGRQQKALHIVRQLSEGDVFLRSGFRRKQTGTYFTHPSLVNFLVRKTLEPLSQNKSPEGLLQLKIVDPAMGSGHFLVAACRYLAEKLLAGYKHRFDEFQRQNPDLPESELFALAQIPLQVARVWHDEERALSACKLLVASHCLYGVDKNPLAVDLAKVTLWIETAAFDQPLTFLDHHFKVGDSLLGIPLKRLLPEGLFTETLGKHVRQAMGFLDKLAELISADPADLKTMRETHKAMESELEPFWWLHQIAIGDELEDSSDNDWRQKLNSGELEQALKTGEHFRLIGEQKHAFSWQLAFPNIFFNPDGTPRENAGFDAVLGNPPWDKIQAERHQFYAEYDPLIGDYQGQSLERRIREIHHQNSTVAERWQNYAALVEAYNRFLTRSGVYLYQFATFCGGCGALLPEKECPNCHLPTPIHSRCRYCNGALFTRSQQMICPNCKASLREKSIEATSGREDLYRFFAERAWQLAKNGGFVGFLLPAAFYATEGATALRRLLLDKNQLAACFSFENRRRLFPIDIRYKFATVVYRKGGQTEEFPAAFMLHDPEFLSLPETHPERLRREVRLTRSFLERTSPAYRLFLEVKNELECRLADRLHRQFPRLGEEVEGAAWQVVGFKQELNMTQDSYLFRTAEQLGQHGAVRQEPDPAKRQGGILYRTPDANWYRLRGYRVVHVPQFGVEVALPDDALPDMTAKQIERELREETTVGRGDPAAPKDSRRPARRPNQTSLLRELLTRGFVCADEYVPLYEGRMVHQFDPAAKAYVRGEGKRQEWRHLDWNEKHLAPHYFVSAKLFAAMLPEQQRFRAGFMDANSATNERTLQASTIPATTACGNKVPTTTFVADDSRLPLLWVALADSFVSDWLTRLRVQTTLNFFLVAQLPMPRLSPDDGLGKEIVVLSARLNCVLPELAELWEEVAKHYPDKMAPQWRLTNDSNDPDFDRLPCIDPTERQFLRARLDALAADAYGLTVPEFAYILTTFPLLDRDQPSLEGEERSTVTRDLALVAFMLHKGWQPSPFGEANPEFHRWLCEKLVITNSTTRATSTEAIPCDLATWLAENAPEAQVPKMGKIRDLEERLCVAIKKLNAVVYIPTRGEREEEVAEEEDTEAGEADFRDE